MQEPDHSTPRARVQEPAGVPDRPDELTRLERAFNTTVLQTAPCLILALDRHGRIIRFNRSCCELTGYALEEALGQAVWELLLPPDQKEAVRNVFDSLMAERLDEDDLHRYPQSYENDWVTKDGRRRSIRWSNKHIRDDQGHVAAIVAAGFDITEQRQAEQALHRSEARYRSLVEHASVCIMEIDRGGRIASMNAAGLRIVGIDDERKLIGRSFVDCVPAADRTRVGRLVARAYDGEGSEFEFTALCPGKPLMLDSTLIPISEPDGSVERVVSVTQDVTDRKRAQTQLIEQESLVRLGQLAAVVAHEVRNPLAGISGVLQILQRRVAREHSDFALFDQVLARLDELHVLTEELLDFSRPTRISRARTSLHALVAKAAAAVRENPSFYDMSVRIAGPDVAPPLDATQFGAVLQNLILNAAQAMDGAGVVRVTTGRDDAECWISVADHGPGIPPDTLEQIFEPFFTTKKQGTGLGLALTKQVVRAHDGTIHAQNPPEGGALFRIVLPAP